MTLRAHVTAFLTEPHLGPCTRNSLPLAPLTFLQGLPDPCSLPLWDLHTYPPCVGKAAS